MSPLPCSAQYGLFFAFLALVSGSPASPVSVHSHSPLAGPTDISVTAAYVANPFGKTHTSTIGPDGQPTSFSYFNNRTRRPTNIVPDCWWSRLLVLPQTGR
ncbi:hypothetical protein BDW62DRAFT_131926 [Aspergillus aurantiobrunneus]